MRAIPEPPDPCHNYLGKLITVRFWLKIYDVAESERLVSNSRAGKPSGGLKVKLTGANDFLL